MAAAARTARSKELEAFAAAVAHELRTPLCALSGEVEIALNRERPAEAYREALARIACRAAELAELTEDLGLLGQPEAPPVDRPRTACLGSALDMVCERVDAGSVRIDRSLDDAIVVGDARRLGRALVRVTEHAVRYRRRDAGVQIEAAGADDSVSLTFDAFPSGFLPCTWDNIRTPHEDVDDLHAAGLLRLRTAARILRECGGSIELTARGDRPAVTVRLRRAPLA